MTAGLSRPIFCLVTDRHRTPPGTDAALVRLATCAVAAGVNLVQVRERGVDDRRLLALTRAIVHGAAGSPARVVVNERADIAVAAGAHGVHLRADSPPADRVRAIVPPGFLIGRSVHSGSEAAAAAGSGVDYMILGTIYRSPSKPAGWPQLGVEALQQVSQSIPVPVLAIGGVRADNLGSIAAAGAAGFAAIGLFADRSRDVADEALEVALQNLVADLRAAFRGGQAAR